MTFVGARAAEIVGDPRRSALLYASLAQAEPNNSVIANRAIGQAIQAGNRPLALRLIARQPVTSLGVDAQLLLTAEQLVRNRPADAVRTLKVGAESGNLDFLTPVVAAWATVDRDGNRALELLGAAPVNSAIGPYVAEQRALLLLRMKRPAEAEPYVRQALANAGGRTARLRLAFADGYVRAGDRVRAVQVLQGRDPALQAARASVAAGDKPGFSVRTPAEAFGELLLALSIEINRGQDKALPISMVQVARYAAPDNPMAPILLALLLGDEGRTDDALVALRSVKDDNPFLGDARDSEMRVLMRADRKEEALARAQAFVANPGAGPTDWARLGDVLDEMNRTPAAADAFGRAIALVAAGAPGPSLWQLNLLRGAMLERANRWPEARAALQEALRLSPTNPLVLNYLGYAQLERGEKLDESEQLIAQAHKLAPEDASITDSLGWAQFKRGKLSDAISTLQRATAADPAQAEIHEHLGDALYTAGRKFEARYSWNAALITAEDDVKRRIEAKIRSGLKPDNAAP